MNAEVARKLRTLFGIRLEAGGADESEQDEAEAMARKLLSLVGAEWEDDRAALLRLEQLEATYWHNLVDSAQVIAAAAQPFSLPLRLPASILGQVMGWRVTVEDGTVHHGETPTTSLTISCRATFAGTSYVIVSFSPGLVLPAGYHSITISVGLSGEGVLTGACALIVTPGKCFLPPGLQRKARIWGISCTLETLRSQRNWGVGDHTDMQNLLALAAEAGAGMVAICPKFWRNGEKVDKLPEWRSWQRPLFDVLHLAPEAVEDFAACETAHNLVNDPAFQVGLAQLRNKEQIDCLEVMRIKEQVLQALWAHFRDNHLNPETARGSEFRRFQQQGGEILRARSLFNLLSRHLAEHDPAQQGWLAWPEVYRQPDSPAVNQFAEHHQEGLEYQQYLQWLVEQQTAAVGQRSLERGLKVGVAGHFTSCVAPGGFETWYYPDLFHLAPQGEAVASQPLWCRPHGAMVLPINLAQRAYQPLITALRGAMHYTGALFFAGLTPWLDLSMAGHEQGVPPLFSLNSYHEAILGVIALESQRNHCLVIAEFREIPDQRMLREVREQGMVWCRPGGFATDAQGNWLGPGDYESDCVVSTSDYSVASLSDYWLARDIASFYPETGTQEEPGGEQAIIDRATQRAHLLVTLHRAALLPDGYGLDPATVPQMTAALVRAVHMFLARTSATIFLADLADLSAVRSAKVQRGEEVAPYHRRIAGFLEEFIEFLRKI